MDNPSVPTVPQISTDDVFRTLGVSGAGVALVDVRTPQEFAKGRIATSINLPLDDIEKNAGTILPNKSAIIYVYCLSGSRSTAAAAKLILMGYNNVWNVTSGLLAWRASGYPMVS